MSAVDATAMVDAARISAELKAHHDYPDGEQGEPPEMPRYKPVEIATPAKGGYRLPTIAEALSIMWAAQDEYSIALELAFKAHVAWSAVDNISSRIRYAATLRLMEAQKISSTAADKIATQDLQYAAHRDHLAQVLNAKLDAEADRDDALSRLISARVTVEALTTMQDRAR